MKKIEATAFIVLVTFLSQPFAMAYDPVRFSKSVAAQQHPVVSAILQKMADRINDLDPEKRIKLLERTERRWARLERRMSRPLFTQKKLDRLNQFIVAPSTEVEETPEAALDMSSTEKSDLGLTDEDSAMTQSVLDSTEVSASEQQNTPAPEKLEKDKLLETAHFARETLKTELAKSYAKLSSKMNRAPADVDVDGYMIAAIVLGAVFLATLIVGIVLIFVVPPVGIVMAITGGALCGVLGVLFLSAYAMRGC